MNQFNIDTSCTEYSNDEVFYMIKKILSNQIEVFRNSYERLIAISHLMRYITDDNLLNSTIKLAKECDLLDSEEQFKNRLYNSLSNLIYSEKDCTKIRAFIYSSIFEYEIKTKYYKSSFGDKIPKLQIFLDERVFSNNLDEINNLLKKETIKNYASDSISKLEPSHQKEELKKFIRAMGDVDYSNDTEFFKNDIEYLDLLKENILLETKSKSTKDNYKKYLWFKLGVIIAKGGLNKYLLENKKGFKNNFTPNLISKELGNIGFEKYILASVNGYNSDKNIYNSKAKMSKIVNHCEENNFNIDSDFISRIPLE